jgi:hypothetical protein
MCLVICLLLWFEMRVFVIVIVSLIGMLTYRSLMLNVIIL